MNKRLLTKKEILEIAKDTYTRDVVSTGGKLVEAQDAKTLKVVGEWLEERIVGGTENTLALKGWDKSIFEQGRMPE